MKINFEGKVEIEIKDYPEMFKEFTCINCKRKILMAFPFGKGFSEVKVNFLVCPKCGKYILGG